LRILRDASRCSGHAKLCRPLPLLSQPTLELRKKMTRKHFQEIADILASHRENVDAIEFQKIANDFAIFCKTQNANFNKEKFFDAVGVST
jgi:hypothetical protein